MDNQEHGREGDGPGPGMVSEATLTLWRQSVPPAATAEDSIRAPNPSVPTVRKTVPHRRSLRQDPVHAAGTEPDFELKDKLGAGGMGVVYAANQTALNRSVAIKMVNPGLAGSASAADALMAEAVVTGGLEHPNVVPVYDLGVDADGKLFYAMKDVHGFPWATLMAGKPLDENLGILLRVADTISFAHSRGILHRDLKPHNIMLGEFGEVMVMDWGASCALGAESSFCGTPAYMPPEMAKGDANRLGVASDVYLLGAILYQIITGHPPRREKDPELCLAAAAENRIDPVEDDGELLRIALKAMAAAPADRYRDVKKFQQAIHECRSHSESLVLLANAKIHLHQAKRLQDYGYFSQAVFGFKAALGLWQGNAEAAEKLAAAQQQYARCAFGKNDYELALSLLDRSDPSHKELLDIVEKAIRDRDAHKKRIRRLLFTARFLVGALLLIFAVAFFLIRAEQRKTVEQHRQSLVNLVSAHYGEQNYEATVATFWELHDQYRMDKLDEDSKLDVRVAAAMNPYRGTIATGVEDALKIMSAAEEGCVWIVGKEQLRKVRLDPEAGYDLATMVSIHDFQFGKRKTPGTVGETVKLPAPLLGGEAVHESADGTLWAGSGSKLYRRVGERWNPVLDVSQLEYPPLPAEFGFDEAKREEFRVWMDSAGRKLPITGILLNRAQDRAVVALGGGVVCWIDLPEQKCLGWYFVDMDTPLETAKYEKNPADFTPDQEYGFARPLQTPDGPQLVFSPDEQWLLYREGCRGTFVFAFQMPSFVRKKYFYSRLYLFGDFVFPNENRCWGLLDYQGRVFSASASALSRYWGKFEGGGPNRWDTVEYETRRIPHEDWQVATLSPNGMKCFLITKDNVLFAGSTVAERGFDFEAQIVGRDWVDCMLTDNGVALALADDGSVHAYDIHRHAVQELHLNGKVVDVCSGHHPDHVFAVLEKPNGKNDVLEIAGIRSATPQVRVVAADTEFALVCCDPQGRWLVAQGPQEGKVFELATGKVVATIPSERGTLFPIKFDERGEYLLCGGEWKHIVKVHRSSDWKKVQGRAPEKLGIANLVLHWEGAEPRVLAAMNGATLKCLRLGMDMDAPSNLVWAVRAGNSALSVFPYADPDTGQRLYWMRTWFDRFQAFDPSTGEYVSEVFTHWQKKEFKFPVYNENGDLILFPTEGGRVEMALRSDLYPVFDPRAIDRNIDKVALNSDESMAALVADGELLLMNLSGAVPFAPQGETRRHHVSSSGLNLWPYDSWETAALDINDAIKAAGTGDEVVLDDGTFHSDQTIVIQDAIALRSCNGPGNTSVTTDGNGVVFLLRSKVEGLTTMDGITVTGGNGPYGGGVFLENTDNVLITNCIIAGNSAGCGGAINFGYEEPPDAALVDTNGLGGVDIVDCVLSNNISTSFGGAVCTWIPEQSMLHLNIRRCEIANNRAKESGGGIHLFNQGDSRVEITDCVISNNVAQVNGGGINISASRQGKMQFAADRCAIAGNEAGQRGGGFFANDSNGTCTVSNTVFSGNSASVSGKNAQGAVLTDCTFAP